MHCSVMKHNMASLNFQTALQKNEPKLSTVLICLSISTEEAHHQYGGGFAVWDCHTISTDVSHLQYGGGCAIRTCDIITSSRGCAAQYMTIKTAQGVFGG